MSIADKLQTIADNEQNVYNSGKKAEYDRFWDEYQKNGKRADYTNAFSYGWNDKAYNPKYNINTAGSNMLYIYQSTEITDTKINIKVANGTARRMFYSATNLKTIKNLNVNKGVPFAENFVGCTALQNLTIEGTIGQNGFDVRWSTLLSKESIESIINALTNNTTITNPTITLSLTAINKAFETSEGANDGSTSTEWITLITPKSNSYDGKWNIALV